MALNLEVEDLDGRRWLVPAKGRVLVYMSIARVSEASWGRSQAYVPTPVTPDRSAALWTCWSCPTRPTSNSSLHAYRASCTGSPSCCARLHVPDPRADRDAFVAATALVHGMTVVTRNVSGFAPTGVAIVDPWAYRDSRTG